MSRLPNTKPSRSLPKTSTVLTSMWLRRFTLLSVRQRRKYLLCCFPILAITIIVYLVHRHPKTNHKIIRTRPSSSKPPLIDRSRMERLGMYHEPEPLDAEWMGSNFKPQRTASDQTKVLSVNRLPESSPIKHSVYIPNALADWQLCGFQDRPCQVLLVRHA
jgi:hypothetical protein